ncbi:MAG: FAD-binding protein, partial [Candidatus Eisenbacteria bacterium]|nr:FAD-binding protein [Candidatus Eisenbacteria bacterium]
MTGSTDGSMDRFASALRSLLGPARVMDEPHERILYESDGLTLHRSPPALVLFPETTEEVSSCLRLAAEHDVPVVPRGAGTGLSGGAVAPAGAAVLALTRMRRILEIDPIERRCRVQPGVANLALNAAAEKRGLRFAPDPSSQQVATIGGNVAENAGGPHTLLHGVTATHVRSLTVVLAGGDVVAFGREPGPDWVGLLCGSEGTLGVVTEIEVDLIPAVEEARVFLAAYARTEEAIAAVSGVLTSGVLPVALEMMDGEVLATLESAFGYRFPQGARSVLIVEIEGLAAGLDEEADLALAALQSRNPLEIRTARDARERAALWRVRKQAFGALGRASPDYYTQDGVVPRSRIAELLETIRRIGERESMKIANVFHAGDGNLHPILLYDARVPGEI